MKKKHGFILILFFFFSCYQEEKNCDCINLSEALILEKFTVLQEIINDFTFDLSPQKTEFDNLGHKQNLIVLTERLNNACNELSAEIKCYACIYTLPVQSEILITIKKDQIVKTIDILTPDNNFLTFCGVHE